MAEIIIYTKSYCPYCVQAKALLKQKEVEFVEINIGSDSQLRQQMIEKSGRTTVPQIFINQKHIGGCDDLFATDYSGELDRLLK